MRGVTAGLTAPPAPQLISTHTPHARRDCAYGVTISVAPRFLLTRLMRGVTFGFEGFAGRGVISTHTPHARRDSRDVKTIAEHKNFYSHASCEA